jgi:hypothetical protein
MSVYICVIECSGNHIYIGDTRNIRLKENELIPKQIIGLYNAEQNYALYKFTNKPISTHLNQLDNDLEISQAKIVETILSDRYFYDRKDNKNNKNNNQWYMVRTGDLKQNSWMASVEAGYKKHGTGGGYYASHRVSHLKDEEVDQRPVCEHGYPCEVHFSRGRSEIYFDCPVKYIWPNFMPELERIKPCEFKKQHQY